VQLRAAIRDGDAARGIQATIHCTCDPLRRQGIVAQHEHVVDCRWRWAIDEIYTLEREEESRA
jgi:hypothetical protein